MSSSSTTSITSSMDRKLPAPPKDYAAAFASLQSSYGANGHAPVLPGCDASAPMVLRKLNPSQPRRAVLLNPWGSQKESSKGGLESSSRTKKKSLKTALATLRASCGFGEPPRSASH